MSTETAPMTKGRGWVAPSSFAAASLGGALLVFSPQTRSDETNRVERVAFSPETRSGEMDQFARTQQHAKVIADLLARVSLTAVDESITRPNEVDVVWPTGATRIFAAIQGLRAAVSNWDDSDGLSPSEITLTEAEKIVAFLPSGGAEPKIGVGGEGDLFFSWENEHGTAFLTIDGPELHLLVKPAGQQPIYRDNLPNDEMVLSNQVLPALGPFVTTGRSFDPSYHSR